jgi:hypothetical protein
MKFTIFFLCLMGSLSVFAQRADFSELVTVNVREVKRGNDTRVDVSTTVKEGTAMYDNKRRFDYLISNVPHKDDSNIFEELKRIKGFYPDTAKVISATLDYLNEDEQFIHYFNQTLAPFFGEEVIELRSYSTEDLMEVASKFFYCDRVMEDTSVAAHICIGLNGVEEAAWQTDYTLLEAFCYEAIFTTMREDSDSQIEDIFVGYLGKLGKEHKQSFVSKDDFLGKVRMEMFERMKANETIQKELLAYYERTKDHLAFQIEGY